MRTVALLAFDDFQLLDLAGPVEVLRSATLAGADPGYRTLIVTPTGEPARSESGVRIDADTSLTDLRRGDGLDTLTVVGGFGARRLVGEEAVLADLRAAAAQAGRITSVCTGAFLLAAAGLLDGYQATTHWGWCEQLERDHPRVEVHADRIYVQDRNRWTSAGVTAGIDLFLGMVEHDHSRPLAHEVARWLVVFARRPGGQAQFSTQLASQAARTPGIDEVQRWLPEHLDDDLSVAALARKAGMSPRTFARAFRAELGTTPAAYVESLRVEAARRLLETSDLTVEAIGRCTGFRRPETLYRAFNRQLGTSPHRYRQHFGPPAPSRHDHAQPGA